MVEYIKRNIKLQKGGSRNLYYKKYKNGNEKRINKDLYIKKGGSNNETENINETENVNENNTSLTSQTEQKKLKRHLNLKEEQKLQIIENCKNGLYKEFDGIPVAKVDDLDGFKFYLQDEETVLVRASGTEPVLRIYAEASSEERVQVILDKVKSTLLK